MMMMVHVNDLEKKIESIINFTNDEEVLRDCTSWLETIDIMRGFKLFYLTLEDSEMTGDWNIH
jgi:hypothetical protein